METFTLGTGGWIVIGLLVLWTAYALIVERDPKAVKKKAFGTGDGSTGITSIVIAVLVIIGLIWALRSIGVETNSENPAQATTRQKMPQRPGRK